MISLSSRAFDVIFIYVVLAGKTAGKQLTSDEVEAKLSAHMAKVKTKAVEDAKNVNLPSYLNPAMVNVNQFKNQQEKRKLLWSAKRKEVCICIKNSVI